MEAKASTQWWGDGCNGSKLSVQIAKIKVRSLKGNGVCFKPLLLTVDGRNLAPLKSLVEHRFPGVPPGTPRPPCLDKKTWFQYPITIVLCTAPLETQGFRVASRKQGCHVPEN